VSPWQFLAIKFGGFVLWGVIPGAGWFDKIPTIRHFLGWFINWHPIYIVIIIARFRFIFAIIKMVVIIGFIVPRVRNRICE
jgi:hypothetical protein